VHVGDRVAHGQLLVTLVSDQATAARAEYLKSVAKGNAEQIAAEYARSARERAERLLELKAVSRQEVDRARVEQQAAESAKVQADADVERTRATLEQLGIDPETATVGLRSPLAGVVLSRDIVQGSIVEPGAVLVTVTDPRTLWLEINATERLAPLLRPNRRIQFSVAELAPATFEAAVTHVAEALDPATRTVDVHAVVRNAAGTLRPAMFATVQLSLNEARTGVAVPDGAIQRLDERPVVFVAHPDDRGGARFERRDVEVGAQDGELVQVVRGLNAGDVVVVDGAFAVKSAFARFQVPVS
jgi:cobalt-zinc-cadmium efflux system membrane fusion protein